MNIEIKQLPGLRVAALRHVGPYNRISEAFARLGELAHGAFASHGPMVALYHDDPERTPEAELRSDAGIVLGEGVTLPAGLTEQRTLAGKYAVTTHRGPYEQLGDIWGRFKARAQSGGQRIRPGAMYEVYRNTPMDVPQSELLTELYVPLE